MNESFGVLVVCPKRTTYLIPTTVFFTHKSPSSVSVTSRREQNASDTQIKKKIVTDQDDSNPRSLKNPKGDSSDPIAYLRSALDSEKTRIMDHVSALIPAQNGSDWERAVKSVFNDSGVVLFQPTINLYGAGNHHRLEPEGSTRNSSSTGPEIINLTEAQEEIEKAAREKAAKDSGSRKAPKTKESTKERKEPEAMSATKYQRSLNQKEEPSAKEQNSSKSPPEQKINVETVTSPATSCDEAGDGAPGKVAPQNISQSDTTQNTNHFAAHKATSRGTGPHLASYLAQSLPHVSSRGIPGSFVSHQIIDCTSDMYDLPVMFPDGVWTGKSTLEEEWGCLSRESSRQRITEHVSCLSSDEQLERHPDLGDPQQNQQQERFDRAASHANDHKFDHTATVVPRSVGGAVSEDSGFLPDNPIDSLDSGQVQPNTNNLNKGIVGWRELGDRVRRSCPPCNNGDVASKMADLCVKAGYGISDALRRAAPRRNSPYIGHRKTVLRDDDDDGMEAELQDLERSEQLLRRELELVHQQAEIRRQRLRITQDNDTSTPMDLISECLWPSTAEGPASNRLLGRRLVANSFSTSQKSMEDDSTDNYFSPTEDYSTTTFLSPTLSLEQSLDFGRNRDLVPVKEESKDDKNKSDSGEELEVIFVEESFLSTDSFSFGEITKKSACEGSTKTKKLDRASGDLSYLKKTQSNSAGLE